MSEQTPPQASPPTTPSAPPPSPEQEARTWSMIAHLSALIGVIIPFGNIIGPLVVWLVKKDQIPAVNDAGKEALNAQISFTAYLLVAGLLTMVVIGLFLLPIIGITDLVLVIMAAIAANEGKQYRYPLIFRLIK